MNDKITVPRLPPGVNSLVEFVDDRYLYCDSDGVRYEWDAEKHAWFPMWDEQLIELQQAAYQNSGIVASENVPTLKEFSLGTKDNKVESGPKKNPSVYITGLPTDVTFEEIQRYFGKCGIFKDDLDSGKPRIKIYKDSNDKAKGDALVTYFREESVSLAISLLDQSEIRPGHIITVQQAIFQQKDASNKNTAKRTVDKRKLAAKNRQMEKQLGWFEGDSHGHRNDRFKRTVVLKNMFSQEELEASPTLIFDLKDDVTEECGKIGEVHNISLIDTSVEGVILVKFVNELFAEKCVSLMNGRLFAGRRIVAHLHDGTKYGRQETDVDRETRMKRYGNWLEQKEKISKESSVLSECEKPFSNDEQNLTVNITTPPRIESDDIADNEHFMNNMVLEKLVKNVDSTLHRQCDPILLPDNLSDAVENNIINLDSLKENRQSFDVDDEQARDLETAFLEDNDDEDDDNNPLEQVDSRKRRREEELTAADEKERERQLNVLIFKKLDKKNSMDEDDE